MRQPATQSTVTGINKSRQNDTPYFILPFLRSSAVASVAYEKWILRLKVKPTDRYASLLQHIGD
jgi:hypothetical protein